MHDSCNANLLTVHWRGMNGRLIDSWYLLAYPVDLSQHFTYFTSSLNNHFIESNSQFPKLICPRTFPAKGLKAEQRLINLSLWNQPYCLSGMPNFIFPFQNSSSAVDGGQTKAQWAEINWWNNFLQTPSKWISWLKIRTLHQIKGRNTEIVLLSARKNNRSTDREISWLLMLFACLFVSIAVIVVF